ncbi:MAG TPA: DNA polymerase III subunit delta [Candidatus Saccharimonadales bacterium]|nr:DNA polymerase III subunit delta [Candidatus Saccharimonadales bacterium]
MIISLCGSNSFELSRRLNQLVDDFIAEHGDLAVERIDGEEVSAQNVIDAVQSLPFLAAKKLVVLRNFAANKLASETIEQIIESAADSTNLVFYEPAIDKRSSYYKTLKSKTALEEFNLPDSRSLAKWLVDYAKEQGGSISLSDANYLVGRVGDNQQILAREVEKLVTYDPAISRQTIDLLTEKTPQSKVFDLLDAAFGGDKKRALELYDEQRSMRVEPQEIMAMLAWQLRILALAKLGQQKSAAEIAADAGLGQFPVSKAQPLAKKITVHKLQELASEAEKIDRLGKSKPVDLDEAIRTYITAI